MASPCVAGAEEMPLLGKGMVRMLAAKALNPDHESDREFCHVD